MWEKEGEEWVVVNGQCGGDHSTLNSQQVVVDHTPRQHRFDSTTRSSFKRR